VAVIVLAAGIFPELFMKLTEIPVQGLLENLGEGVLK
jgi:hypothetical protein